MLRRVRGYLLPRTDPAPAASLQLEQEGYAQLEGVFDSPTRTALKEEIEQVYASFPPDGRAPGIRDLEEDNDFRYQMCNRSPLAQQAIGHRAILDVIEPLLGEDCHVIANTCWRNPPNARRGHGGGFWHIDAGPHIPRDPRIPWDERIPYPVFAIGAHIYLEDCALDCGPTGVIPGSHKSGMPPPKNRHDDMSLEYAGRGATALTARAGDVCLFVSDIWHRRLPVGAGDRGRFFLQVHYGRRDIAQRLIPASETNQITPDTALRARDERERQLLGLHENRFYDG